LTDTNVLTFVDSVAIGKRITPKLAPGQLPKPGNHHYCFVDFASAEEAERAMKATDGKVTEYGRIKVNQSRTRNFFREEGQQGDAQQQSSSPRPRRTQNAEGGEQQTTETPEKPVKNWERTERISGMSSWRK